MSFPHTDFQAGQAPGAALFDRHAITCGYRASRSWLACIPGGSRNPLLPDALREIEMSDGAPKPWPTELRLRKDRKTLTVVFDNGEGFDLSAEYLRVKSPSAEVQGHSPDERKTVAGKKGVAILEVNPIGNYAVRLVFDDMHSTGIYSWDYLLALGRNREAYWQDYLDDLAGKGLQR
jgi:DUF971 family protein